MTRRAWFQKDQEERIYRIVQQDEELKDVTRSGCEPSVVFLCEEHQPGTQIKKENCFKILYLRPFRFSNLPCWRIIHHCFDCMYEKWWYLNVRSLVASGIKKEDKWNLPSLYDIVLSLGQWYVFFYGKLWNILVVI